MLLNHLSAKIRLGALVLISTSALTITFYLGETGVQTTYAPPPGNNLKSWPKGFKSPSSSIDLEEYLEPSDHHTELSSLQTIAQKMKSSWFNCGNGGESSSTEMIAIADLENYGIGFLDSVIADLDFPRQLSDYGLHIGSSPSKLSLATYTADLIRVYHEYVSGGNSSSWDHDLLSTLRARLSLRPPAKGQLPPCPKHISTTDVHSDIKDLPSEFLRWTKIMPDWPIRYFDDGELVRWVEKEFGGTKIEELWKGLPRQVLKTDLFRYMTMLVNGGIYTDSDTAPIIPAEEWGYPYERGTPPILTHLSRMLSLANPSTSFDIQSKPESESNPESAGKVAWEEAFDEREDGEPGLVVSVESDAIDFGWDWRDLGLSRAVQITQWSFMARPGHPVFLDAIGQVLRKTETILAGQSEDGHAENALEWTGPGIFTDCVYRYLLARWGFKPEDLIHVKSPLRVGDVLILPAGSYSSVPPWEDQPQRDWAAVYHGFKGRWRDTDPALHQEERKTERA